MLAVPLAQCEPVSHRRTPARARPQQLHVYVGSRHTAATLNHIERHARSQPAWRDQHWGPGFSSRADNSRQGQGVPRSSHVSHMAMSSTWSAGQSGSPSPTATSHKRQPTRLAAADIEELNRGLADLHRRRQGFLCTSRGQVGPGLRHKDRRKGSPTRVESHPRAHQYGRGLPSTEPATKALPFWQAAQEVRDCVPMHQWLRTKDKRTVPSPGEAAGFQLEQEAVAFTDCGVGTHQELVLPVRNTTRGPLRVRLRRKPVIPAFQASLMFPTGAPVAAGLAAELHVVCHGSCIANGGCEDWLDLEVEGRARRILLKLSARAPGEAHIQPRREIERQQAVAEVVALPSTF